MKASGYDQFFQAAKKAKTAGQPAAAAPRASTPRTTKASPEDRLVDALKKRTKEKAKKKQKAVTPWGAIVGLLVSLFFAGWFVADPDLLQKLPLEIGWVSGVEAASTKAEEKKAPPTDAKVEGTAAKESGGDAGPKVAAESWSKEDLNHFNKLNERKRELDQRESELNELEEELQRQKTVIEDRIRKLEELREQVAVILKDRVEVDEEKVNKLVEFYSNMKPKQAAEILGTLNEDLAVEVLGRMKKKNAAEIMNLLNPGKAQVLSEKYAGYKRR